jgi:hypothetical protein
MFYIKVDSNKNPVGHPITGDNLKQILDVQILDVAFLQSQGYVVFEFTPISTTGRAVDTGEYYMAADGIVRNKVDVRPFTTDEALTEFIRIPRSNLLFTSDWTQANDSPLSPTVKAAWATYRQQLRDLTKTFPNVQKGSDVTWPVPPGSTT